MAPNWSIAQALDSILVLKIPTEPKGAAKIFKFQSKINILHSKLIFKPRIQVRGSNRIVATEVVI